jgi:hypothetical protein
VAISGKVEIGSNKWLFSVAYPKLYRFPLSKRKEFALGKTFIVNEHYFKDS